MRSRTNAVAVLALILIHASAMANETPVVFSSGDDQVTLIELYTSEGCSSCPPADRWLSKLKSNARLWHDFVPISFHVDYWDYIGWRDRFASSTYSDRHRRYRQEGGTRVVYTPGFFKNGQEWRSRNSLADDTRPAAGDLSVQVTGDTVVVHFENSLLQATNLVAHVAVLGMNLETEVRAGENKGKRLKHDFVALTVVSVPLDRSTDGFEAVTDIQLSKHLTADMALVAWISADDAQMPLQAVGGFLPGADQS